MLVKTKCLNSAHYGSVDRFYRSKLTKFPSQTKGHIFAVYFHWNYIDFLV